MPYLVTAASVKLSMECAPECAIQALLCVGLTIGTCSFSLVTLFLITLMSGPSVPRRCSSL